jgi:hypothetical protein
VGSSSNLVSAGGVEGVGVDIGVGVDAMPRISAIAAGDLEVMFLETRERAR